MESSPNSLGGASWKRGTGAGPRLDRKLTKSQTFPKRDGFRFHSRLLKIGGVERGRGGAGGVAVERVAVVEGEGLPRPLVLGEVPAGGELRLQNLRMEA